MINENEIKNKGPEKVTFMDMVAVSIQRLMNPKASANDKKKAADGLLTLAKVWIKIQMWLNNWMVSNEHVRKKTNLPRSGL